jgi:hypothetical protein
MDVVQHNVSLASIIDWTSKEYEIYFKPKKIFNSHHSLALVSVAVHQEAFQIKVAFAGLVMNHVRRAAVLVKILASHVRQLISMSSTWLCVFKPVPMDIMKVSFCCSKMRSNR